MYDLLENKEWNVGIYARLSREDEKNEKYKGQSESIENQIRFLKSIVNKRKWILFDIYIDDGYTGTNFNRPGFMKMIQDIELRKINLVITKDLSRLGRDYIETGRYVEKYFPLKNVRYIAVNDNIDTFDYKNASNDITPFKSVINDMYAKDISNKVRTAFIAKANEGECIKAFLPYGYKRSKDNKIIVDEDVSSNIKLIFNLYKNGKNKTEIARYLNQLKIKTPLQYKVETTNYYNPNNSCTYKWNSTIVNKILRDDIYVGDLSQLKYSKINYKVKKIVKVPKDSQILISNNHEAIIERKIFNAVQEMLNKKSNEWNYAGMKKHLLTGLVFCKCGSRVTYNKNHGKYFRCVCSGYKKYGKNFCSNIHLKEDELSILVAKSLKENITKYIDQTKINYKEHSNTYIKELLEFNYINEYNVSLVFKLIEKIIIYDKDIVIKYKFNNEK